MIFSVKLRVRFLIDAFSFVCSFVAVVVIQSLCVCVSECFHFWSELLSSTSIYTSALGFVCKFSLLFFFWIEWEGKPLGRGQDSLGVEQVWGRCDWNKYNRFRKKSRLKIQKNGLYWVPIDFINYMHSFTRQSQWSSVKKKIYKMMEHRQQTSIGCYTSKVTATKRQWQKSRHLCMKKKTAIT